jgi:hypothetical protein
MYEASLVVNGAAQHEVVSSDVMMLLNLLNAVFEMS